MDPPQRARAGTTTALGRRKRTWTRPWAAITPPPTPTRSTWTDTRMVGAGRHDSNSAPPGSGQCRIVRRRMPDRADPFTELAERRGESRGDYDPHLRELLNRGSRLDDDAPTGDDEDGVSRRADRPKGPRCRDDSGKDIRDTVASLRTPNVRICGGQRGDAYEQRGPFGHATLPPWRRFCGESSSGSACS